MNALPRPNFPLRFADAPRDRKNPCGMWGSHRKNSCQRTYRDVLEEWREIYGWVPASSRSRMRPAARTAPMIVFAITRPFDSP